MSLRLFLGESEEAASRELIRAAAEEAGNEPERRFVVIVPEQSTFETQRRFLAMQPRRAMLNIEVLSFGHVAERVRREFALNRYTVLSDDTRMMLLAVAVRSVGESLTVYKKHLARPGFIRRLASLFAEWEMNALTPEKVRLLAEKPLLTPLLKLKLTELAGIYGAFHQRMKEGELTAEALLPFLNTHLAETGMLEGTDLFLTGFTGFTAVQYEIIGQLFFRCRRISAAFVLPQGSDPFAWENPALRDRHELFAMSREAVWKLKRLAEKAGRPAEKPVYAAAEKTGELKALAERLYRESRALPYKLKPDRIRLFSAENAGAEAQAAVEEVRRLTREQGLAYRDIAVVTGAPERYGPLLESAFTEAGIPWFSDRKERLDRHPLIRLIDAALEAVSRGLERDAVLRFVKNPCGPLSRSEADLFENFVLAAGIRRGRGFREPFNHSFRKDKTESAEEYRARTAEELTLYEPLRQKTVKPLLDWMETFGADAKAENGRTCRAGTVAAGVKGILRLLEELNLEQRLTEKSEALLAAGKSSEADSWGRVYTVLTDFLSETEAVMGGLSVNPAEFSELISAGFSGLDLGHLPEEQDQLVIGDIERSRYGSLKALIFLGLNEGVVPSPNGSGGILTDSERRLLAGYEEEFRADLGFTAEKHLTEQRFYLYLLLTGPSERLILSFSRKGSDQKALQASPLLRDLQKIFPLLETEDRSLVPAAEKIYGSLSAKRILAECFGKEDKDWPLLYSLLRRNPEAERALAAIEDGAFRQHIVRTLRPETAEALYGPELKGSVSRLQKFASCPYAHFLQSGIGLLPRDEGEWENTDHGDYFHAVMEYTLKALKDGEKTLDGLSDEELKDLVDSGIRAASAENGLLDRKTDQDYRIRRWTEFFDKHLKSCRTMAADTGFTPDEFELRLSGKDALTLPLSGGRRLRLSGIIDRIDVRETEDALYFRIVDYKTGDNYSFDLNGLRFGLSLQLAAYLDAAAGYYHRKRPEKEIVPSGMYYAHLTEHWTDRPDKEESERISHARLSGITSAAAKAFTGDAGFGLGGANVYPPEAIAAIRSFVRHKMAEMSEEILSGSIDDAPYRRGDDTGCEFCEFKPVCRFDRRLPGNVFRELPEDESKLILQSIQEEFGEKGEQR